MEKLQAKVKEEIGESDPEARYNLGIAYKEMGLLDEAAEEFRRITSYNVCYTKLLRFEIQDGQLDTFKALTQKLERSRWP